MRTLPLASVVLVLTLTFAVRPVAAMFSAVDSMSHARHFHTATLLGNGRVLIAGGTTGTGAMTSAELFDPASGAFKPASNLSSPRRQHTATLLPNGKVLIAGGNTGAGATNTAELFDPALGSFTPAPGTMTSARHSHTATMLSNGKVLIAGGYDGTAFTSAAELFDPASGTFSALAPMNSAHYQHTATLLQTGEVLIVGGGNSSSDATNTAERFNPVSGTFTPLAPNPMITARTRHTATLLASGMVLIAGGYTGDATANTAELFDPASGTFALLPPMTSPRQLDSATLLPNGRVLLAGGYTGGPVASSAELFDPASGTFMSLAPDRMLTARAEHTATLLPGGEVLIAAGDTGAGPLGTGNTAAAELFDSAAGSFSSLPSLNVARFFPTATLLPSGKVLIAGGEPGSGPSKTAELFDPVSQSFALVPSIMARGRFRHTATLLTGGQVLIAGGDSTSGGTGATNSAELFDPVSETFTLLPPMTSRRWAHTATLLPSGKVLLAGGLSSSDFQVTNTAELFDPASQTFTAVAPMSVARDFHTATLLGNGKVLIAGGFNPAGGGLNTAELFDPATQAFTLAPSTMTTKRYYHSSTLLPGGKVLIAGGGGTAPPVFSGSWISNRAELFDPASGTFTDVPDTMTSWRYWQTATLLPSGKVLIADGSSLDPLGSQYTRTAEVFDPATRTFTLLPLMSSVRFGHTATLLPDGRVLIAAGTTGSTATNTAELFDEGLGFADARRPVITSAPAALIQPAALELTGSRFRGDSEASGSSFSSAATNYPLLQLTRIDNEQSFFALSDPATNWSDSAFRSEALGSAAALPDGYYRATIFTNAIPSLQQVIRITAAPTVAVEPGDRASSREFTLAPVAPSPARGAARIEFALAREARVRVTIVDLQGREIVMIADGVRAPGRYQAVWSGERQAGGAAPAGVYFVRCQAMDRELTRRIVLIP